MSTSEMKEKQENENNSTNEIRTAMSMHEGDGAEVQRLFPLRAGMMNFDPFVLWDHFSIEPGNGFPTHPHRGFEAITYMFSGSMAHKDNLGNESTVTAGGAQRFTAGRGLEHSEMPASEGSSSGIQLWVNLPKRLKNIEPDYQQADSDMIPVYQSGQASVRVIAGATDGIDGKETSPVGPVSLHTLVSYLDVSLAGGGDFNQVVPTGWNGILYVVEGALELAGGTAEAGQAYLFSNLKQLDVHAQQDSRFMLAMGQPHGEPIIQHGPFVD